MNQHEEFMRDSSHSDHAQMLVRERIEELRSRGATRGGIVEWLGRRGYLKTEIDRKIVESELRKAGIQETKAGEWEYRKRIGERIRKQSVINRISNQMIAGGRWERARIIDKIKNKKSKYL